MLFRSNRHLFDDVANHLFGREAVGRGVRTQPDAMAEDEWREIVNVFREYFRPLALQ